MNKDSDKRYSYILLYEITTMTVKERREYDICAKKEAEQVAKNAKKVVSLMKKFNLDNAELGVGELTLIPTSNHEIRLYREIDKLMTNVSVVIEVQQLLNICEVTVMHGAEERASWELGIEYVGHPFAPHKRCIYIKGWKGTKDILGIKVA